MNSLKSNTTAGSHEAGMPVLRARLGFLDGIRGLAALYVMLYHVIMMAREMFQGNQNSSCLHGLNFLFYYIFGYGNFAVGVFIVLSGFSLMIPVARDPMLRLRGGLQEFAKRRAKRILPPYYAAAGICLILLALLPHIGIPLSRMEWYSETKESFAPVCILTHLFLVHNWTHYFYAIEAPLWSVGLEWQIYFVFALFLLPVYRKYGCFWTLFAAFVPFCAPVLLHIAAFHKTCIWFVGLFAMGMAGAAVCYDPAVKYEKWRAWQGWGSAGILCWITTILYVYWQHWHGVKLENKVFVPEVLLGTGIVCFIVCHALRTRSSMPEQSGIVRILQLPAIDTLGLFSYSLYLMHYPVLELCWYFCRWSGLAPDVLAVLFVLLSVPAALLVSWLFHLTVERRFLPSQLKKAAIG